MRKIISFLSAISLILFVVSCSNNDDNSTTTQPYLSNFSNSGCKQYVSNGTSSAKKRYAKIASATNDATTEQIVLKALGTNKLYIVHENASLSCEAVIDTDFKIVGSTIFLTEKSTDDTNCICNYDLSFTIDNLQNGAYDIIIMRQTIDRNGKTPSDGVKYCEFSITFADDLSQTVKL